MPESMHLLISKINDTLFYTKLCLILDVLYARPLNNSTERMLQNENSGDPHENHG